MILHHCKLTAGDTLSWLLEKRHQINYWWILHNYRIIYEYSLQVILYTLFQHLTTAISSAQKKYSSISTILFLDGHWRSIYIICYRLMDAVCPYCFCITCIFFSLSKISLNILLIFRLKKFSAVCSFYWVLPGYLISGDWIKMPFFSLFPARFMLRLHVLNLEVQECSRQHKIVLKICFIIN